MSFGRENNYPRKVTDWDEEMVAQFNAAIQQLGSDQTPAGPAAAVNGPPR
jgi:hypothetical protein